MDIQKIQKKIASHTERTSNDLIDILTCTDEKELQPIFTLADSIQNVQTSWVMLGLEGALACISIGANDLGSALYEENITGAAGGRHGQYVSKHTFYDAINRIGKKAVMRDTVYSFQKENVSV